MRVRCSLSGLRGKTLGGLAAALGLSVSACGETTAPPPPPPPPPTDVELRATTVANGLQSPVFVTAPSGDSRLFIVEQTGLIRILDAAGQILPTPFADLRAKITTSCSEQGLLGLAFHPQYASNGFVFVNYTRGNGDTVVERYRVGADPDRLDPASAFRILLVDQPGCVHNGGQLLFGPDGMLYVFLGDGRGAGDPLGNGQNLGTLLGSILRIDIDGGSPYAVPPGNPFVGMAGARPEIWAYGLRNPWRGSFDPQGNAFYVADVGQDTFEEVNAISTGQGGVNFGWNTMEGSSCFGGGGCNTTGLTLPVIEYGHGESSNPCSVTGGYVYRGSAIPEIVGHYFYSDFCAGFLRSFRLAGGQATDTRQWDIASLGSVSSFGVDGSGELYVVNLNGSVARLERAP